MLRFCFSAVFIFSYIIGLSQNKAITLNIVGVPKGYKSNLAKQFPDSTSAFNALQSEIKQLQFIGYFNIDIEESAYKNDTLYATLNLGELYKGLYLKNGNIASELINDLNLRELFQKNRPLALKDLSKTYSSLLSYYQNNGYPFAQIWLDSLKSVDDQIQAKVMIDPHKKIQIDTIRLVGNAKLSQSFLSSYLSLKNGENYNEEKIINIEKRLRDLPYLNVLRSPEVVFSGNGTKINLFIDKQNANQFDGIIGFLPNNQTGKLQLTGDFKLNLKNALKSGETLDFNYRGLPQQSQELNLGITYPYLFKSQLGISTSFQLFKRDTSFLNLNTKLAFDYNFSLTKKVSFFVESFNGNQVSTSNEEISVIPQSANINSVFYGLALAYVNLDNKLIPLKGADFNFQAAVGKRKISPSQNFNPNDFFEGTSSQQYKFLADLRYYLKLSPRSVIFLHNQSAILTGNNIFENEAFRIGGFKTLRGFDEQSINASSFSIQTTEFRYFIEKNSFVNLFYDQAYVSSKFNNQQSTDYPFGLGAGITFQTKIGITSLSYALGKQKNIPVDLQKGKIHIGILSYF